MKSLFDRFHAFGAAEGSFLDKLVTTTLAMVLAPSVELSLATAGLRCTVSLLDALPRLPRSQESGRAASPRAAVELAFACQPLLRGLCLERALVEYGVRRMGGLPARLVVGVRRGGHGVEAHAWVESPSEGACEGDYQEIFARVAV